MKLEINDNFYYYEYKVKNSKFCCYLQKIKSKEDIKKILEKYHDDKASHHCYAYVLEENGKIETKGYDDKEPRNSAGNAMLYVLLKQNLTNVLVLNIRYFRPPQLGVGNLMKAYQHGIIKLLSIIKNK